MKKYILTGLMILLPIAITLWIVRFFFDILTAPFIGLIKFSLNTYGFTPDLHPVILFFCKILVLIIFIALICILGFIAHKIFFDWILKLTHKLFSKIPIVKSIYKITQEIIKSIFSPGAKPFKKTVMLDFPNKESRALGFYTGDVPQALKDAESEMKHSDLKTVFLPTAPHPISGFLLVCPSANLTDVNISVEEVFKILISCGSYRPGEDTETNTQEKKDANPNPS
ncbi:MAG: DUF502 domain-containing protein [Rhabdochlamydiaceae bacterium]|nr:DUF502 domain-containing protein [Candidatus Amphrikana amoebophyrae]